jgi:ubiquinone biosynthesis protein Coq4
MSDNYLVQDCDISLKQALDRYYAENPDFYQPSQLDDDSRKVFFAHDVCHIIFGCDTSLVGEAKIEQWTIHSTNFNLKEYFDSMIGTKAILQAASDIYIVQLTVKLLLNTILNITTLAKIYLRAKKVKPKWDYYNYKNHLDRRIIDIRREFNIQII